MTKIIGIRFKEVGKIYYFAPGELDLQRGEQVIVETSRGLECGHVVLGVRELEEKSLGAPLKPVIRRANDEDIKNMEKTAREEEEAFVVCREKIIAHGLEMKLISAEYTFDRSKLLFYFTAEGRIDFRELVKELASIFRVRIELRQVGVRDETKLVGGLGSCGRVLCCHSYLSDFVPVSIRMAKEQGLSLNPQKISGVCGRLMCCLKNENETYEKLNAILPREGDTVETPEGIQGTVAYVNVLRKRVKVLISKPGEDKEFAEYDAEELRFTPGRKKGGQKKDRQKENAGKKAAADTGENSGRRTPDDTESFGAKEGSRGKDGEAENQREVQQGLQKEHGKRYARRRDGHRSPRKPG